MDRSLCTSSPRRLEVLQEVVPDRIGNKKPLALDLAAPPERHGLDVPLRCEEVEVASAEAENFCRQFVVQKLRRRVGRRVGWCVDVVHGF
jgi:hypothetical protein